MLFVVAFTATGCMGSDDDLVASAVPTTTGIPVGAPGAVGARVEQPAPVMPYGPRTEGIQEKINPVPPPAKTGPEPVIPPSPFGVPPDDEDPQPVPPPTKKQKGTKI